MDGAGFAGWVFTASDGFPTEGAQVAIERIGSHAVLEHEAPQICAMDAELTADGALGVESSCFDPVEDGG